MLDLYERLRSSLLNYFFRLYCRGFSRRFRDAVPILKDIQKKLLFEILDYNKETAIGQRYHFARIKNINHFQSQIPLSTYEDYIKDIDRISNGENNVLTKDKVLLLEPSSGSTSATKLIPYTRGLKKEFQQAVYPWLYDLYDHLPQIGQGKCYWSISPISQQAEKVTGGKIPVGFESDTDYFGTWPALLLKHLLAVPQEVAGIQDFDTFRYVTLLFLLRERRLTFISIWNPSFLTILLAPLSSYQAALIKDIEQGTLAKSDQIPCHLKDKIMKKLYPKPDRARELRKILGPKLQHDCYQKLWPQLTLVSCWGDGQARAAYQKLKGMFPDTYIQPKGLLATEGVISFPLTGERGCLLAIRSHFFEFLKVTETKQDSGQKTIYLAQELERGETYAVVITTSGGFYRYQLQDLIRVTGFKEGCPLIEFIGKKEKISDHCGEKLNELHVLSVLKKCFHQFNLQPEFYMIAPEEFGQQTYAYTLFIKIAMAPHISKDLWPAVIEHIEQGLGANFHYRYCQKLGQLSRLKIFLIDHNSAPEEAYLTRKTHGGQKAGDVKPAVLDNLLSWSNFFTGFFIGEKYQKSELFGLHPSNKTKIEGLNSTH